MQNFEGKRVYITGGSSGIGLETARQLSALGAHIVLCARDPGKLEQARLEVEKCRRSPLQRIVTVPVDVSCEPDVQRDMGRAVQESGAPDILIHSAGRGHADYFENISSATFDAIMQTNVYGTRNVIAALLPFMKERGGHIVILSSAGGLMGMFGYTAYGTSKYALVGFAECLRSEVKRYHITVSVVCPPEVDTPLVEEEGKTIPPEARAVKRLAGCLSPLSVAGTIIKGIRKETFLIIPGFKAKTLYYLQCYLPRRLTHMVQDLVVWMVAKRRP